MQQFEIHYTRSGTCINNSLHQAWIQYQVAHPKLRSYTTPCKLACFYPKSSSKISPPPLYNGSLNCCVFCKPTVLQYTVHAMGQGGATMNGKRFMSSLQRISHIFIIQYQLLLHIPLGNFEPLNKESDAYPVAIKIYPCT